MPSRRQLPLGSGPRPQPAAPMIIRPANLSDAAAMLAIYAPIVEDTAISFEAMPPTLQDFTARVQKYAQGWAWLVAEREGPDSGLCLRHIAQGAAGLQVVHRDLRLCSRRRQRPACRHASLSSALSRAGREGLLQRLRRHRSAQCCQCCAARVGRVSRHRPVSIGRAQVRRMA